LSHRASNASTARTSSAWASWQSIGLKGDEIITIPGLTDVKPRQKFNLQITYADGVTREVPTICRIDTENEITYYRHGGILHYVLRNLAASA
jgi:aconitate hydratase